MKIRTEIKLTPSDREAIEALAEFLNWGLSETVRRALKFGLTSLYKFETSNKKADLRALIENRRSSKGRPTQKDDTTNEEEELTEEETRDMYELDKDLYGITETFEEWLPKFKERQKQAREERIKAIQRRE